MKCPKCRYYFTTKVSKKRKATPEMIGEMRHRRICGDIVGAIAYDLGVSINLVSRYTRDLSSKKRRSDAKLLDIPVEPT